MARTVNIRNVEDLEGRLANVLERLLSRAEWLAQWTVRRTNPKLADAGWDLIASGPTPDEGSASLYVECKLHFQPSQFSSLVNRPRPNGYRVLGLPYVSPRMAELCELNHWSWFDLAGNCRLEIPEVLLIERSGAKPVRIEAPSSPSLGSNEAASVLRALLAPENAGRRWTQREIVTHVTQRAPGMAAPSLALVNKVVQYIRQQAFLEPLPTRGFRVSDHEGLLKVWRQAYRFDRYARRRYFTLLSEQVIAGRLRSLGTNAPGELAYSAFSAADWQAPHVRQHKTWLYVNAGMEAKFRETIEAKEVDSGENLMVVIPKDPGVFYELDLSEKRLACTNPVQTYIDLTNSGGRGEEAAEAILNQMLMPAWTGTGHER
jgi:hypothetical protein